MILISTEEKSFIRMVGLSKTTVNMIQDSRCLVRDLNGLLCDFQTQALQLQTARSVNICKMYHRLYIARQVLHKQITKCKEQGLSGEDNRRSAAGQIPWLLWKTDVHNHLNKSTILVPINSPMTPFLTLMDNSSQIDFNIILQHRA